MSGELTTDFQRRLAVAGLKISDFLHRGERPKRGKKRSRPVPWAGAPNFTVADLFSFALAESE